MTAFAYHDYSIDSATLAGIFAAENLPLKACCLH